MKVLSPSVHRSRRLWLVLAMCVPVTGNGFAAPTAAAAAAAVTASDTTASTAGNGVSVMAYSAATDFATIIASQRGCELHGMAVAMGVLMQDVKFPNGGAGMRSWIPACQSIGCGGWKMRSLIQ